MLHHCSFVMDIHIGEGVCTAFVTQQERITLTVVTRIVSLRANAYQATVGVLAPSGRNPFTNDSRTGVLSDVDHLRTRIGLLVVIGYSHTVKLSNRIVTRQDTRRIFPRDGTTRFYLRPRQLAIYTFTNATFGNEIVHASFAFSITRIPVLYSAVFDFSTIVYHNLYDSSMQLVLITHWSSTAFEIGNISIIIGHYALAGEFYTEGADQMAALRIEDALWWQDGLVLDVRLQKGPGAADRVVTLPDGSEYTILWQTDLTGNMTLSWDGQEDIYGMAVTDAARSTEDCLVMELVFTGLPAPERGSEPVEAVLNCGELEIPFTLACAGETPPEEYAYALGELGGVLAIPSRSERGAAVELYPLNSETFSVEPWMTRGAFLDPDPGAVTLTGADGRVWEGTAAGFNPYGTSLYSRWEFGDLPPGDYTLSVPYLLVSAPLPEEFVLPLPDGDGLVLEAPGGSLTAHVSGQPGHLVTAEQEPGAEAFYITFDAAPRRADLTLAGVWLETEMDGMPAPTANGLLTSSGTLPDESGTWAGLEVQLSPDVLEQGCRLAPGVRGKITWKWAWPVELTLRVP